MLWKTRSLRIGEIGIRFKSNSVWPFTLKDSLRAFRSENKMADLLCVFNRVAARQAMPANSSSPQGRHFDIAALSGTGSALLSATPVRDRLGACLKNPGAMAMELRPDSVTMIDFALGRADLFYTSTAPANHDEIGFGPAMLAPFLPGFNALLLHASAVVRQGRAALFLAPDEGGKTTAALLSPSGTILGDDQVLLRRAGRRFQVWGTPWGLHVAAREHAPLAGLFLLEKADRFSLEPLSPFDLVPHIWEEIKNPLAILPKPLKKKAFGIACAVAAAAPAWKMSFAKSHIDWDAVDRALRRRF
jgi:hypothetical protein